MFHTEVVEEMNTHFVLNNFFFENLAVYEIMWKAVVEPGRTQMTKRRTRVACWIPKAAHIHSQYVILIAFPLQQWWQERAFVLCSTYIACLVPL
jgi:hypothetical protein